MKLAVVLLVVLGLRSFAIASGHGPVFGLATPTNSQGEWSFDEGIFGRNSSLGSQASIRTLMAYGFTPHLTLSFTLPAVVGDTPLPPTESSRVQISTPQSHGDSSTEPQRSVHVLKARPSLGLAVPGPQSGFKGVAHTTNVPGTMFGVVSGMASRSHYVWLGSTFTKFYEHNGDRRPDVLDYSLVYGYRPQKWRRPPDKWDWRLFGELVGERSNRFLQAKRPVAKHASPPSVPRTYGTRNFSQLHRQLRCAVPDLSKRRFCISEGARSLRVQHQLLAFPAWKFTLGDSNEENYCRTVVTLDARYFLRRQKSSLLT